MQAQIDALSASADSTPETHPIPHPHQPTLVDSAAQAGVVAPALPKDRPEEGIPAHEALEGDPNYVEPEREANTEAGPETESQTEPESDAEPPTEPEPEPESEAEPAASATEAAPADTPADTVDTAEIDTAVDPDEADELRRKISAIPSALPLRWCLPNGLRPQRMSPSMMTARL